MIASHSRKRGLRTVGVIASRADLDRALRMCAPPDFFELRLDCLAGIARHVENALPKLRGPVIITARHPREGGARELSLAERRDLLGGFLIQADYIDVELRSAPALRELLTIAHKKNVGRIISFHDFKETPRTATLVAKAGKAKAYGADIFKVATRTDTPLELGRLLDFITNCRSDLPLAVMGFGKLGAISRLVLARAGSVLIYASIGSAPVIEGQLSLRELRRLGIGLH